ncbi:MAG: sugar phosphate isomerase/epimerase [Dysgonamonadaceae bacterium]|jgi:sugar phosphate isomerase/epimerase|nr:sugar phosphate isomerase/epimerase [Dysgonamonadaceae bacterium]
MTLDRRNFLKASAITLGGAAVSACCGAKKDDCCAGKTTGIAFKPEAELKLSFQEWTINGDSLKDKLDFMETLGVAGLEVGGDGLGGRVDELNNALKDRNIKISAICAGFKGFMLAEDEAVRNQCRDTMREIIVAAGKLGSTGVIIVPAFNSQKPCKPHTQETRDFLCEWFNELGTFAHNNGTTVIFEPLNRGEAFYLRQVADAASICRDINNPGVRCMGDFWHMTHEETSDMGAFISAGEYLQHVHVASRKRRLIPGEDGEADNYVDGFKGLKTIGFNKYVSFECGSQAEDKNASAAAAVELLRKQWAEA